MQKNRDEELRKLRRYIFDETRRLEKRSGGKVHRFELGSLGDDTPSDSDPPSPDPLEKDLDLLFDFNKRNSK